jgi:hypothetical protein
MAMISITSPRSRSIEAMRVFGDTTEIGLAMVKGAGVVEAMCGKIRKKRSGFK